MSRRAFLLTASTILFIPAAACGTLRRPSDLSNALGAEALAQLPLSAAHATHAEEVRRLASDLIGALNRANGSGAMLALSGGGANAAFGAGVLRGWTDLGSRPDFDIVTGVSSGALASVFAFLGSDWDERLRLACLDADNRGILGVRRFGALVAPSAFSSSFLRSIIEKHADDGLLQAVAAEHAKGRRLWVATTNLDAEEAVIWDMGLIAGSTGGDALSLFRDVLLASSSIPGVFPPVLLPGRDDAGRLVEQMHVDGGVNTPFVGIPQGMLLWTKPPRASGAQLYVLVNSQLSRPYATTPGGIRSILSRSYASHMKASLREHLVANADFAVRNGMTFKVASIPPETPAATMSFNSEEMERVYEFGRSRAIAENLWKNIAEVDSRFLSPAVSASPSR